MTVQQQIADYIASQPEPKRDELTALHAIIKKLMPRTPLWFLDGKDANGKTVTNPNIGYGAQTMPYADGRTREFYQIGLSGNTTGISVYIMGLTDKKHLVDTYAATIGKASVTGYCIKFKTLSAINVDVLKAAILDGVAQTNG